MARRLKVYPALHPGHLFPGDGQDEVGFVHGDRGILRFTAAGLSMGTRTWHLYQHPPPERLRPPAGLASPSRPCPSSPAPRIAPSHRLRTRRGSGTPATPITYILRAQPTSNFSSIPFLHPGKPRQNAPPLMELRPKILLFWR